ncbi:MAG TPA: hypothetical protein VE465_02205 [Streptosporangiaceae bacterium]|jgi:hypothetical protein|nr:hypothetical protein [Streptosporangiaceae bacterium]
MTDQTNQAFAQWAIVELFGHKRFGGYVTEAELAGDGFIRIDIPGENGTFTDTHLFNPKALYGIHPTTEQIAKAFARHARPEPVHRWELESATPRVEHEPYDRDEPDLDGDGPF